MNSSGNSTTSRLTWATFWTMDTASPRRRARYVPSAPPSSASSQGTQASRDRRAPIGRSVALRLRTPATRPSRASPATSPAATTTAACRYAPGSRSGLGPSRPTSQRASSAPSSVPIAAGRASSSTALPASAPGPTPRADSSRTSARRRSAQYDPAAPTSSSASRVPPSAMGSTGPRRPSRISSARSVSVGQLAGAAVGPAEVDRLREPGRGVRGGLAVIGVPAPGSRSPRPRPRSRSSPRRANRGPTSRANVPGWRPRASGAGTSFAAAVGSTKNPYEHQYAGSGAS